MLGRDVRTNICVEVEPFYLYNRLVAFIGKLYNAGGYVVADKYAYLPHEIEFDVKSDLI